MAEVVEFPGSPLGNAEPETVAGVSKHAELAEVIEADVVEGVVVDEAALVAASAPLRVVQVVRVVVQHEHTKTAGRHLAYIPIGASVVAKRLWDSRTTARYERFIRAAEATGNHEAALEWDDRMQRFRKDRHERRVAMIEVPIRLLLAVPKIALGLFLLLAVIGVFLGIATKHIAEIATPFEVVARIVEWVALAVSVSWGPVVLALPWIALSISTAGPADTADIHSHRKLNLVRGRNVLILHTLPLLT